MLTADQVHNIEGDAIFDYMRDEISNRRYAGERIKGQVPDWYDADANHMVPASCIILGPEIRHFILGNFEDIIDEFLKINKVSNISELAEAPDLENEENYYDFVFNYFCPEVEEYVKYSRLYEYFCNNYFEKYAEKEI